MCTGGAPARGEVDDAQALGGECLAILRVVGDLDHTSALAARAERPHGGRRRRYWQGQGERTNGARGSHDGGAPDAGGSSAPNDGRRPRGADEASGPSGEHRELSARADGTSPTRRPPREELTSRFLGRRQRRGRIIKHSFIAYRFYRSLFRAHAPHSAHLLGDAAHGPAAPQLSAGPPCAVCESIVMAQH